MTIYSDGKKLELIFHIFPLKGIFNDIIFLFYSDNICLKNYPFSSVMLKRIKKCKL